MIAREALARYLASVLGVPVEIRAVRPLKASAPPETDPKGFGYGVPFGVECLVGREVRRLVVSRTRPAQGFGHDYPADRAWQALYGHVAYNTFPRHVRSVDAGLVRTSGELVSVADASEFFQLVEWAPGQLYWLDLDRLLAGALRDLDTDRADALARFLAEAHAAKRSEPTLYHRRIRELVAHGECLMGILDSYPHPYALLPTSRCAALETGAVAWRWRIRDRVHRLSRVHGDFHPWNILFREGVDFSVLDRSRGEWGEPADDVAGLAVNYLFFGLRKSAATDPASVAPPFDALFFRFFDTYLSASGDAELLDVLPPFLAFRALVIAHPRWYPTLAPETRAALIRFATGLLEGGALALDSVPSLLRERP